MSRTALVVGATGLVGTRCVACLSRTSEYASVRCLVRRAGAIPGAAGSNVEERVVDFGALTDDDVAGIDDVFCAMGTTMKKAGSKDAFRVVDHDLPLAVARRAVAAKARRFVLVSSVGASATSSTFYLRTKGELEDALATLGFTALHVLRPSFLLGSRSAESRTGEAIGIAVARLVSPLLLGGLGRYRAIEADDVARAMVAAAIGTDPASGRAVYEYADLLRLAAKIPSRSNT
jgi:uncharacterized protein YbjT (DUF2867 family)